MLSLCASHDGSAELRHPATLKVTLDTALYLALFTGGLQAWRDAGLRVDARHAAPHRAPFFRPGSGGGAGTPAPPFPLRPQFNAATREVEAAAAAEAASSAGVAGGAAQLADSRSWREYAGGDNDYPYRMPLGRIPNAVWAVSPPAPSPPPPSSAAAHPCCSRTLSQLSVLLSHTLLVFVRTDRKSVV